MSVRRWHIFLTAVILALHATAIAQINQVSREDEAVLSTSDKTYVTFGQGIGNYKTPYGTKRLTPILFEGQISPDFFVNLSKDHSWGLTFFPKIIVRMFNEESLPVRTPSYAPSLLLYQRIRSPFRRKMFPGAVSENQLAYMTYRLIHHSNGQNGPLFIPGTDSVNFINGNFSTNALEVSFSWSTIDSSQTGRLFMNNRIGYERQLDFEREAALKDVYYYNKLSLETRLIYSEKFKAYLTYGFMWGTRHFGTRHMMDIFFAVKPFHRLTDFSVFVRGYVGPDYYNLYYVNILRAATIGIIADPLSIPIFKKEKRKKTYDR